MCYLNQAGKSCWKNTTVTAFSNKNVLNPENPKNENAFEITVKLKLNLLPTTLLKCLMNGNGNYFNVVSFGLKKSFPLSNI